MSIDCTSLTYAPVITRSGALTSSIATAAAKYMCGDLCARRTFCRALHPAKSQVDPRLGDFRLFRNAVFVYALSLTGHHQEASVRQQHLPFFASALLFRLQHEFSRRTERHRS